MCSDTSGPAASPGAILTISHTAGQGTILDGLTKPETRKGGEVRAILDAQAWTWRPSPGWFQRQSRDRPARMGRIQATADRLRQLGYQVEVSIDETPRGVAEQDVERAKRMQDRAETLTTRADRLYADGSARREQAKAFFQSMPLGEPIHGPCDRTRREKEHDRLRRGMDIEAAGDRAAAKADSAAKHMDHRYSPQMVANRIARLETEASKLRLYLDEGDYDGTVPRDRGQPNRVMRSPITDPARRERLTTRLADVQQQLAHWRGVHERQITDGTARRDYGPGDVAPGDHVRVRGQWRRVARVNGKSLSVETGFSCTGRVPYREVTAVRSAVTRGNDGDNPGAA